jgi:hypothetical protein
VKESHSLALIVAYYLSKYDKIAYAQLGFSSITMTHENIGKRLGVKANTVKNMRDEFDPFHDNPRVGWRQRQLPPSRVKVFEAFQELSQEELRDVVLEILNNNKEFLSSEDFSDVVRRIKKQNNKSERSSVFIVRGPTGRKAEENFIAYHKAKGLPEPGNLKDTRDHGCGYDFKIVSNNGNIHIEVKGLDGDSGGVTFTSKEWDRARTDGNRYYLVVVRNVSTVPTFQIIKNPYKHLSAKKSVFTAVQVRWNVPEPELLSNR